jgi:hypothetical protein
MDFVSFVSLEAAGSRRAAKAGGSCPSRIGEEGHQGSARFRRACFAVDAVLNQLVV